MIASNEAGFVGFDAAATIRNLNADLAKARAALAEVNAWIVCAAIASPADMMKSAERIEENADEAFDRRGHWRVGPARWKGDPARDLERREFWDVLHRCRRAGSADSAIDPKSLVVNEFAQLFAKYPGIVRVYFNGVKAAELYRRLADLASADWVDYRRLPSTSPAHVMPPGAKLAVWQAISAL